MMLFLIGLELEPRALGTCAHKLLGLGGLQIVLTLGRGDGRRRWRWASRWQTALAIGMILALSSTAIVLQTLSEKGLMQTPGGRSAFSVLLTQDIAVIPMLALLPLLARPADRNRAAHRRRLARGEGAEKRRGGDDPGRGACRPGA